MPSNDNQSTCVLLSTLIVRFLNATLRFRFWYVQRGSVGRTVKTKQKQRKHRRCVNRKKREGKRDEEEMRTKTEKEKMKNVRHRPSTCLYLGLISFVYFCSFRNIYYFCLTVTAIRIFILMLSLVSLFFSSFIFFFASHSRLSWKKSTRDKKQRPPKSNVLAISCGRVVDYFTSLNWAIENVLCYSQHLFNDRIRNRYDGRNMRIYSLQWSLFGSREKQMHFRWINFCFCHSRFILVAHLLSFFFKWIIEFDTNNSNKKDEPKNDKI